MTTKRLAGLLLLLLAVGGALGGSVAVRRSHERSVRRLADRLAQSAGTSARDWLAGKLKTLEGQAAVAAQLTPIKQHVLNFDGPTLQDGFRTEEWWAPYRRDFSLFGMALDADRLEVVEGMDAGQFEAADLIRKARASRQAALFLRAGPNGWPWAAAAAAVDLPRPVPAVVVLARPVDVALAQEMADKLGHAVLVSDGRQALLAAGSEAERERLKAAVGQEGQALVAAPDGSWAAAPVPLVAGLTVWAFAAVGDAEEFASESRGAEAAVWAVAGLLALAGLGLAVKGGPAAPAPEPAAAAPSPAAEGRGKSGVTPADTRLTGRSGASDPRALAAAAPDDSEGATAVQAAPGLTGPNVFGRYKLLDRLGEGGMAEVYTAVAYGAERFRRTFVVKRLRAEMLRNPEVVNAFIDEANLASSLVHSNIVPVFDFGKVGDEYYMATEYILGRDLGRVNRRSLDAEQKPLPMAQVFYVAHQVLEALDYAHAKTDEAGQPLGIVHRDVSPNNVLITQRGEVKLFDFGIAKSEGRLTQTQFGMVKGNVRFMSPEQARGEKVDSRSDLFSLGLVIYYALSGDALYRADTAYNLLVRAAQGPGQTELDNLAALPREAQRVLERALQPDPAARFQTAAEFATSLQPYLAGQKEALARAMERLFGDDMKDEQARFAAAAAGTGASDPAQRAPVDPEGATARFATPPKEQA